MAKKLQQEFSEKAHKQPIRLATVFAGKARSTEEQALRAGLDDSLVNCLTTLRAEKMTEKQEAAALRIIKTLVFIKKADVNELASDETTPLLNTVSNVYPNREFLLDVAKVLVKGGAEITDEVVSLAKLNKDTKMVNYLRSQKREHVHKAKLEAPAA